LLLCGGRIFGRGRYPANATHAQGPEGGGALLRGAHSGEQERRRKRLLDRDERSSAPSRLNEPRGRAIDSADIRALRVPGPAPAGQRSMWHNGSGGTNRAPPPAPTPSPRPTPP